MPNLSVTTPTPNICFSPDVNNNTIVAVNATASINTYFIRIADFFGGNFNTLSVGATAQAQRNPLIMSLILDVSYSMTENGGSTALAPAVENFIEDFDPGDNDTIDWVSVVTFGTFANVNLANTQPLKGPVDTVMGTNFWAGGHYQLHQFNGGTDAGRDSDPGEDLDRRIRSERQYSLPTAGQI